MDREEAIRRIKAWNLDSDDMEVLAVVIPELAESEDERMYARVTGRYTRFEKYYLRALGETEANKVLKQCEEEELWIKNLLEKQKDLDKMIVVSPEVWDKAISDAFENGEKDGEKQKEQKPAEWSKEYKRIISEVVQLIEDGALNREEKDFYIGRLKSLRPQPKQEWSEEDDNIYNKALDAIYYKDINDKDEVVDALKALCDLISRKRKVIPPYARWKPSEEQVIALRWILNNIPYNMHKEHICHLYEQLKKLI